MFTATWSQRFGHLARGALMALGFEIQCRFPLPLFSLKKNKDLKYRLAIAIPMMRSIVPSKSPPQRAVPPCNFLDPQYVSWCTKAVEPDRRVSSLDGEGGEKGRRKAAARGMPAFGRGKAAACRGGRGAKPHLSPKPDHRGRGALPPCKNRLG